MTALTTTSAGGRSKRRTKCSCRYCRDTLRWRAHLFEHAVLTAQDPNRTLVRQRCPYCHNVSDILLPPRDWRRIKRERRTLRIL